MLIKTCGVISAEGSICCVHCYPDERLGLAEGEISFFPQEMSKLGLKIGVLYTTKISERVVSRSEIV